MAGLPFTLRQLEYFVATASEGSLAAAAERCHVSASALALALDELEYHLALKLFVRRKARGVTLTPAGSRLLVRAQGILSGAEALAADAWQAVSGLDGRFAIGCFPTLAPFYLPGIMESFQRRYPGIELELLEAAAPALEAQLLQGRIDVALMYSVDASAQLAFDPVQEFRPYVMVAGDHRFAGREHIQLGEMVADPLILLDVHPSRLNTEHLFGSLNLRPLISHTTTNFELVRCLVGRGLGYSVLFQRPASPLTYEGRELAILELDDKLDATVVGLARPTGSPRTARMKALLRHLGAAEMAD